MVSADERGLITLPKPVVAFVEHDHFVAVTGADKKGVTYSCADCAPAWPGGQQRVSWKQWRAMDAVRFLSVVRPGSEADRVLQAVLEQTDQTTKGAAGARVASTPTGVQIAATGEHRLGELVASSANPLLSALFARLIGHVALTPMFDDGEGLASLRCIWAMACPEADGGIGAGGPSCGDPVNLSTLEEQYHPEPDLVVYNPSGPAVAWGRLYQSYRGALIGDTYNNDFGQGWSHVYNAWVDDAGYSVNPYTGAASTSAGTKYLVLPNGSRVSFSAPSVPNDPEHPLIACTVQAGVPILISWQYGGAFRITFKDGTSWLTLGGLTKTHRLNQISDVSGGAIQLNYQTSGANTLLTSITNAATGAVLLSLTRDYGVNGAYGITRVSDAYGRSVYYIPRRFEQTLGTGGQTLYYPGLEQVSQIVATGATTRPARFTYGYTFYSTSGSDPALLSSITVPSPTGVGTSTSSIAYNGLFEVTRTTDGNGNTRTFTKVDGTHTKVTIARSNGVVDYSYTTGFSNHLSTTSVTDGTNVTLVYQAAYADPDTNLLPSQETDGNNRVTTYNWDRFGNLLSTTTPRGTLTTLTWDYAAFALGRPMSVQEGSKPATTLIYHPTNLFLVQSVTAPSPTGSGMVTTSFAYNGLADVTSVTAPGNNAATTITTTLDYGTSPKRGQPLTITNSLNQSVTLGYSADGRGNLAFVRDALGYQTDATYNIADQLENLAPPSVVANFGRSVYVYQYLTPGGPMTRAYLYDANNALIRDSVFSLGKEGESLGASGVDDPGRVVYDAAYRPSLLYDGKGSYTSYFYNPAGYLQSLSYPGGNGGLSFTYDNAGNVKTRNDGRVVTTYQYDDADGLLSDIQYSTTPGLNVHFGYDTYGRQFSMTDGSGSTAWAWGNADELQSVTTTYTGLPARSLVYNYYPDGSRQSMVGPGNMVFSYGYDAAQRLRSLQGPSGLTQWDYHPNGWLSLQLQANGATTSYGYYQTGTLARLLNQMPGGAVLSDFNGLGYDGESNLFQFDVNVPAVPGLSGRTNFGYGSGGTQPYQVKLRQEQSNRNGGYNNLFVYDDAGNATTFANQSGRGYNAANQHNSGGPLGTFVYDTAGNPTTYRGSSLAFDAADRLTSVSAANGALLQTSGYTGESLRAWKQLPGQGKRYFLYDGADPVCEMDAAGGVIAWNTFGASGLAARTTTAETLYYFFDPLGSVSARMNHAGGQSHHLLSATGQSVNNAFIETGDPWCGYKAQAGYYTDHETGLVQCTFRFYDAATGRFLNRDPIHVAGGLNLYDHTLGNPVNGVDPLGLEVRGFFDRRTGILTFRDIDTNERVTVRGVFSGEPGYRDPSNEGEQGLGPIPKGEYDIKPGGYVHHFGNYYWYELRPASGKDAYGRSGFQLHAGTASAGCITVPSDISKGFGLNPRYPFSKEFERIKRLLDNTKPKQRGRHWSRPAMSLGTITVK